MKKEPTYDLEEIKELLKKEETRHITQSARQGAVSLGYADDEDMARRALKLIPSEFDKTMQSIKRSVLMQDVYYTYDGTTKIYIKLQISWHEKKGVIISFKEEKS